MRVQSFEVRFGGFVRALWSGLRFKGCFKGDYMWDTAPLRDSWIICII